MSTMSSLRSSDATPMISTANDSDKSRPFVEWVLPHMDAVYTASLYLTHNQVDAEDLFQETYLRAYRFFHTFTPGTNCRGWLLTIQHNLFRNRYRHKQRTGLVLDFEVHAAYEAKLASTEDGLETNPETLFLRQLLSTELADALKALPEEYRTTLLLVDVEELTYDQAAHVLGCPIGTVRSRLSRARRKMQKILRRGPGQNRARTCVPIESGPSLGATG